MPSRISVLGTSDLRREDGTQVQSVVHQPRRFALLVYLALASRQNPVRRDRVMGVFWADKPQDKARGALNQAVHYLRRSLGQDAILTTNDTIALDRTLVSCDAAEFLDAIDGDHWKKAADLYGGELLPGFYDSAEAVDFEHWLEAERNRLQQAASRAAWSLAKTAETAGETADAVVWARRACDWSANDEAEVRRVMQFMAELGDRTGVLEAFESLQAALRPLEIEPAPETTDVIRSLRQTWEEEDATARTAEPASVPRPLRSPAAESGPTKGPRRGGWGRLRRLQSGAVTLVLTLALISLWGLRRTARPATEKVHPTILVEALKAEANAPVATGALGDQVVTRLQSMTNLNVLDGTEGRPPHAQRANFVLRSGLVRTGDQLQANVHLIDAATGRAVASEQFDRTQPDSLATLDELSGAIANFTRRAIGAIREERRIANADAPPDAITLVQLGRGDLRLADSLTADGVFDAARASYEKADSTFAEAARRTKKWNTPLIERSRVAYKTMVLDMVEGRVGWDMMAKTADHGVSFANEVLGNAPDDVEALEMRARLNWYLWNFAQPDSSRAYDHLLNQAEQDARLVTNLAPHEASAWNILGGIATQRGDWADAYWALTRAIDADTYMRNNMEIVLRLFQAAWETNDIHAAAQWCALVTQRMGTAWPAADCKMHLAAVQAVPDTAIASQFETALAKRADWARVKPSFDALAAVLYARAGDNSRAVARLRRIPPDAPVDYSLVLQAWAQVELGNRQAAQGLIRRYVAAAPAARSGVTRSRRFAGLTLTSQR